MAELQFGKVRGQYKLVKGTTLRSATGRVTFTPIEPDESIDGPKVTTREKTIAVFDGDGWLHPDEVPVQYVELAVGRWEAEFRDAPGLTVKKFQFDVTPTGGGYIDLPALAPITPGPAVKFVVNEAVYTQTLEARDEAIEAVASVQRGEPDGVASLDGDGVVPEAQLPDRLSASSIAETFGDSIGEVKGAAGGLASLDGNGDVPDAQLPTRLSPEGLLGTIGAAVTAGVAPKANAADVYSKTAADARYARYVGPVYYLDIYRDLIMGPWVTGQTNTNTTLTAAADVGATTLSVASGTPYPNGTILLTNPGTANQRQYKVTAGGGTTALTVTPAVSVALASGATIRPLWGDSAHLSEWTTLAYFTEQAKRSDGTDVIQDPGDKPIVLLGNSWFVAGGSAIASRLTAKYPAASVINKGVNGNTSNQLLARFDADVPNNAAYVIIDEPGVNDATHGALTYRQQSMQNLGLLVAKIRAIGAVPVVIGPPPLALFPNTALDNATWMREFLANPAYPDTTATVLSKSFAMPAVPATNSIAIGFGSQRQLTTAVENITLGDGTLLDNLTASQMVAIGNNAARSVTGGNGSCVFIGSIAGYASTTGGRNVFIGANAGYPSGANASKAASNIVAIGWTAGASDATDPSGYTAIGAEAKAAQGSTAIGRQTLASGQDSTAVGQGVSATFAGSVAIGRDNTATPAASAAINEVALGTALHTVKVRGRINVAPRTPTGSADAQGAVGDIASDDNYVYVKTSTGWKRSALSTW